MSAGIALSDAPRRFLDAEKWAELRSFAKSDLIALTYINALYPDEGTPNSFFCGYEGSFKEALHCYQRGRAILAEFRLLFVQGKLIATGTAPDGKRVKIPSAAWINLWPLFATERANGPDASWASAVSEGRAGCVTTGHQHYDDQYFHRTVADDPCGAKCPQMPKVPGRK